MSRIFQKMLIVTLVVLATIFITTSSGAALESYSQDFETMTPNQGYPPNDLSADGWSVFGIVWDTDPYTEPANQVYAYGPFGAANGAPGSMQGVATGEGGPAQGDVVLNKYSDYNNTDQTFRYIQALTFQQQTIGAEDIGLWRFTYDAKIGNLEADSSAFAYIQTIHPTLFFQTGFVHNDSTELSGKWGTYALDFLIDESRVGDVLSFGFSAISTEYNGSAVFYDNLSFGRVDADGDGIPDSADNCMEIANANQRDTDGDGIGNFCDADLNDDCIVNVVDLGIVKSVFFSTDADADFNGDGIVNVIDVGLMKASFFEAPGPSGLPNACM